MSEKKEYIAPEIEIIIFETEDVLTASEQETPIYN